MNDTPPFRFGVSQFTSWPWSFEQDVENYARLEVDAIEVCEAKLDEDRYADQLALIEERGLAISSAQPAVRTLFPSQMQPEPKDIGERTALFCRTIERFGRSARGVAFVSNTGPPPDNGNIEEVFASAAREYRKLSDFAEGYGARVALEPLSPALMNVETAIWTLGQAGRIVEAVGRENFGVCVDLWNLWQNAGAAEEIEALGVRVFVAQVSDWRTPRSYADRRVVGQGEISLAPLLLAVHRSGYRGAYVLEIFSQDVPDSLWDADPSRVIEDSRAGLVGVWGEAFGSP